MEQVELYCRGNSPIFHGGSCEHYDISNAECILLKTEPDLRKIFDKGRCRPLKLIQNRVWSRLSRYPIPRDEEEDIVAHVAERVARHRLKKAPVLPVLLKFIERAVISHMNDILRQQKKRERFVSNSPSDIQPRDERNERVLVSLLETDFPVSEKFLLEDFLNALYRRREELDENPKLQKKYVRQEIVFLQLVHLRLREGYSKQRVITELALKFGKGERTIRRDIEELENFLWS